MGFTQLVLVDCFFKAFLTAFLTAFLIAFLLDLLFAMEASNPHIYYSELSQDFNSHA